MMKCLPADIEGYKKTPVFTAETIPPGILNNHRTKAGVWGRIVVLEGRLLYTIHEPEHWEGELTPERHGVVEPEMLHQVAPASDDVRFYVEFCR